MQLNDVSSLELSSFVNALVKRLDRNLVSCMLYGSSVRGDSVPGVSDLNLLIVLEESTPAAHAVIAEEIADNPGIEPFIIGRAGMERSIRAFATKFLSIRRNYSVLHGEDVLSNLQVDAELERFLVEQSLRNQRLRLVHAYVRGRRDRQRITQFIVNLRTPITVNISEAMRLAGIEMPREHNKRWPIFARELGVDTSVFEALTAARSTRQVFSSDEVDRHHASLFGVLDQTIRWIEARWPNPK